MSVDGMRAKTMEQIVNICKADPIGVNDENLVRPVVIRITQGIPEFHGSGLASAREFYAYETKVLALALFSSLPQGTLDRLVIVLQERTASLYRGTASSLYKKDPEK